MKSLGVVLTTAGLLAAVLFVPRALGWRSNAERWKADRDRFRGQVAQLRADSAREAAIRTEAERQRDAALDSARQARRDYARADSSYQAALAAARNEPAPPECVPVVVAYEAVVAKADSAIAALRAVADHEREARLLGATLIASLERENVGLRAALDTAGRLIDTAPVHVSRIPDWLAAGYGVTKDGLRAYVGVDALAVLRRWF